MQTRFSTPSIHNQNVYYQSHTRYDNWFGLLKNRLNVIILRSLFRHIKVKYKKINVTFYSFYLHAFGIKNIYILFFKIVHHEIKKKRIKRYIFNGIDISSASRYNNSRNTAFIVHQWIIFSTRAITSPQSSDLNPIVHSELNQSILEANNY